MEGIVEISYRQQSKLLDLVKEKDRWKENGKRRAEESDEEGSGRRYEYEDGRGGRKKAKVILRNEETSWGNPSDKKHGGKDQQKSEEENMQAREETGMLKEGLEKSTQMVQTVQKEQRVQYGRDSESAETQREAEGVQKMEARWKGDESKTKGREGKGDTRKWKGKSTSQPEGNTVGRGEGSKTTKGNPVEQEKGTR